MNSPGKEAAVSTWMFEPGHTEAEFRARHLMVTWVRGLFKDIHGTLEYDRDNCLDATFAGEIDATRVWTGEPDRGAELGWHLSQPGLVDELRAGSYARVAAG
jgi:polyisoprenoid-binding protein YceI